MSWSNKHSIVDALEIHITCSDDDIAASQSNPLKSRSYVTNSSRIAATTDLTDTIGADSRESLNTGGDGRSGNSKHGELHG